MQTLMINIENDSLLDKILWMLGHFKSDGVEVTSIEDADDIRLIAEAKKDNCANIPFESVLMEFGVAN